LESNADGDKKKGMKLLPLVLVLVLVSLLLLNHLLFVGVEHAYKVAVVEGCSQGFVHVDEANENEDS
jgi:competence protein ComGC